MKLYKQVILTVLVAITIIRLFSLYRTYQGITFLTLMALSIGFMAFACNYANGRWPGLSFFKATCYGLIFAAASVLIIALHFSRDLNVDMDEILRLFWERTPQVFITPLVVTPLSLLVWRWLLKEPRQAREATVQKF